MHSLPNELSVQNVLFAGTQGRRIPGCAVTHSERDPKMNENEILLIEDSDSDAQLAERALRTFGITNPIRRFSTGRAALEYLARVHQKPPASIPSVLLLDLNLPDVQIGRAHV